MTTFAIATLGCKVNAFESESYTESLIELGYQEVDFKSRADVYIINTCSVTNTATSKSRQKISQAQRSNPEALICVVGCYVQTHQEDLKKQLGIDVLIGAGGKNKLASTIRDALHSKGIGYQAELSEVDGFEELKVNHFQHQTRAFLKVQDGCDQFCSYCIIPFARGRERSLDPRSVIDQAAVLSESHPEIVLAGIHTGRYGKEHGSDLATVIQEILHDAPKLHRIRISSIEVTEITDGFIALMKNEPRIARHLHIPIQSGCDQTLHRMNRPYTVMEFLDKISMIRQEIPGISISTDLIVGFPQESEEEFLTTLQTMMDARFSFMHVFPYSKREYTEAAKLEGHTTPQCKKQRVQAAQQCSQRLNRMYLQGFVGKSVEVLLEHENENGWFGHSSEYLPVITTLTREHAEKDMLRVEILDMKDDILIGREK